MTTSASTQVSRKIDGRKDERSAARSAKLFSQIGFALIALIAASYAGFLALDADRIQSLTIEDGPIEWSGALALLAAATIFFRLFVNMDERSDQPFKERKNIFFLAFGILFLLGFFEEISWGQRILNIPTPKFFNLYNEQHEINLHNLKVLDGMADGSRKGFFELLLNPDRMFSIFWFSYCVLIPVGTRYSKKLFDICNRIKLPIVAIEIGICFLMNYMVFKLIESHVEESLQHNLVELKETIFEILFFIVAWSFLFTRRKPALRA